jgi:aldehyde:ferredoxin oxidoreductase
LRPYPDGGAAGYQIPLAEMLAAYYLARGWDSETGAPVLPKLAELSLQWVAKDA